MLFNKQKKILLPFLLIITFFLINNTIVFAKTDYTCKYTFKFPDWVPASESSYSFSVNVDTAAKNASNDFSAVTFSGLTQATYSAALDSSFNTFYEQAQKSKNGCPDVFTYNDNGQFNIKVGNFTPSTEIFGLDSSCLNVSGGSFCGQSSSSDSNSTPRTVEYCTRTKPSRNNDFTWTFEFYTVNGEKMFSVKSSKSSASISGEASGSLGVNGTNIQIDSSMLDKLYSNKCSSVDLYLQCSSEDNITLVGTQPAAGNNCSYVKASDDDGTDVDENGNKKGTNENNGSINPNDNALDCEGLLGPNVLDDIETVLTWLRIGVPILLIILGSLDFGKAVLLDDSKILSKATSTFIKRAIVAVAVFLAPSIIMYLLRAADQWAGTTFGNGCDIGNLFGVILWVI